MEQIKTPQLTTSTVSSRDKGAKVVFVALDARFTHSNPAIRSILNYVRAKVPAAKLPELIFLEHNINQSKDLILNKICDCQADACFFSAYIWNIELIKCIVADLKQVQPQLLIGLGGPEVAYSPEASLREIEGVDIISTGEGELPYSLLLPRLLELKAQAKYPIPGFAWLDDLGDFHHCPDPEIVPLDQLPFLYPNGLENLEHRYVYYESSRGCPFNCSYCLSSLDHKLRVRSLDLVKPELGYFMEQATPLVKFIDRSFNAAPSRAREIWRFLIDHTQERLTQDKNLANTYKSYLKGEQNFPPFTRFHFEIEARLLERKDFELLAEAPQGLFQFEVGIQSFSPRVLRAVNRAPETADILRSLQILAEQGRVHCHADLIFGLPEQDMDSIARSFRLILTSRAEQIQLGFLKVLKGTAMATDAAKRGFIWEREAPYEVLATDLLTYQELRELKHLESVFERFNSEGVFQRSRELILELNKNLAQKDAAYFGISLPESGQDNLQPPTDWDNFDFFLQAGKYFYRNGLLDRSLSRDEFFSRFYDFVLAYGQKEDGQLASAIRADYEDLPRGNLATWERLRQKYPGK
ncbi:MAG: DUF4080 domain-containing protein [Eubacteriales bacterium]|nr:DUF4080 domain-containing protein [Eubacteriales bacterium]